MGKSQRTERLWRESGRVNDTAEAEWRENSERYNASASTDIKNAWNALTKAGQRCGFGRTNALPIKNATATGFYLAKCITNGFRERNPEDQGIRRVRFWGNYPRKVSPKFYRLTKGATRWRGKMAFCARVLGFEDFDDFAKCFGPQWFIYLKRIIRLVPIPVAEASLISPNLRCI